MDTVLSLYGRRYNVLLGKSLVSGTLIVNEIYLTFVTTTKHISMCPPQKSQLATGSNCKAGMAPVDNCDNFGIVFCTEVFPTYSNRCSAIIKIHLFGERC